MRRHIIMDHEPEHMVQRFGLGDMFGAATNDRTDFRFGDHRTPVRIDKNGFAVSGQAGWRLQKEIRNARIMMRLFHQFPVVEGNTQNF